jgi:hypothetical protein
LTKAAGILNDRVFPFFEEYGIPLTHILTGRGTEFKGSSSQLTISNCSMACIVK